MRKSVIILSGIAAVVVIGGIAASCGKAATPAASAAPVGTTATVTHTVTAPPAAPVTVTAPAAPPVTVTVTAAPAAPAASADPAGPKDNGKFLVGSQVSSGTWQCDKGDELPYWSVNAKDNSIIDNGLDTIAVVVDNGYMLTLGGCQTLWKKVG